MSNKVQFVTGLLSGLILPAISWLIFDVLCKNWVLFNKPAVPYLVSVCANLLVARYLSKRNRESVVYGMVVTTFIVMWTIFKFKF